MNFRYVVPAIAALSTSVCTAQDCTKFVVLDNYSSSTDRRSYDATKHAICSSEARNRGAATDAAVKAGIPIPLADTLLDLSFGGSTSASNYDNWKLDFCKSDYNQVYSSLKQTNLAQIFSNNAAAVTQACFRSGAAVYGYYDIAADKKSFTFYFRVNGKDKLKFEDILPKVPLKNCSPQNLFGRSKFENISGLPLQFTCDWDSSQSVHTQVVLENHGTVSFNLPSIPTPPPPAQPNPPIQPVASKPEMVLEERTFVSDAQWSGSFKAFSDWSPAFCTLPLGENATIVGAPKMELQGDRTSCDDWAACRQTVSTPQMFCMETKLQGHEEDIQNFIKPDPFHPGQTIILPIPPHGDQRQSKAVIKVIVQHPKGG